jgi:hypothetical protein
MQRVRYPAEGADIAGLGGILLGEIVLGGADGQRRERLDMQRRMHQQVKQEQERKSGFPPPQAKH